MDGILAAPSARLLGWVLQGRAPPSTPDPPLAVRLCLTGRRGEPWVWGQRGLVSVITTLIISIIVCD